MRAMINGAHAIIYSKDADADRAFLRDVLSLPNVDVGGGWLIFGLPPAEVAVHPTDGEGGRHELYFMCPDVEVFVEEITARGLTCSPISDQGWGRLTSVTLPGGSELGVYEPRHARPAMAAAPAPKAKPGAKPTPKATPKATPKTKATPKVKAKAKAKAKANPKAKAKKSKR
jgi:hypothetical protein